jgi:hypothetical protein
MMSQNDLVGKALEPPVRQVSALLANADGLHALVLGAVHNFKSGVAANCAYSEVLKIILIDNGCDLLQAYHY